MTSHTQGVMSDIRDKDRLVHVLPTGLQEPLLCQNLLVTSKQRVRPITMITDHVPCLIGHRGRSKFKGSARQQELLEIFIEMSQAHRNT